MFIKEAASSANKGISNRIMKIVDTDNRNDKRPRTHPCFVESTVFEGFVGVQKTIQWSPAFMTVTAQDMVWIKPKPTTCQRTCFQDESSQTVI